MLTLFIFESLNSSRIDLFLEQRGILPAQIDYIKSDFMAQIILACACKRE
jgi:hypothetical protein